MSEKQQQLSSKEADPIYETEEMGSERIVSKHRDKYFEFYKNFNFQLTKDWEDRLQAHNIIFDRNCYQEQLNICIIGETANHQILKLCVSFSYFMFQLLVLNVAANKSCKIQLNLIGFGTFGKIYFCKDPKENQFAMKRIRYLQEQITSEEVRLNNIQNSFKNAIYQYCIYKLFSALEIGPEVYNNFGFDLIAYDDYIQFAMQVCMKKSLYNEQLYQSLKLMHSFNIIHGDIKPENIMWSPKLQKLVYVDFGFSRYVKSSKGQMSFTSFFGTYYYSSAEMKQTMNSKKKGYVDLFYNDLHCLKAAFQAKVVCLYQTQGNKFEGVSPQFKTHIENIYLCYLIYSRNYDEIGKYFNNRKHFSILPIVIEVLNQFPYDEYITKVIKLLEKVSATTETFIGLRKIQQKGKEAKTNILKKERFSNRLKEIINYYQGSKNYIMRYVYLNHGEDISPRSIFFKKKYYETLTVKGITNDFYWYQLVQFCLNSFVNMGQFSTVLDKVLQRSNFNYPNQAKAKGSLLQCYAKARFLAQNVWEKFKINLYDSYQFVVSERKKLIEQAHNKLAKKQLIKSQLLKKNLQKIEKHVRLISSPQADICLKKLFMATKMTQNHDKNFKKSFLAELIVEQIGLKSFKYSQNYYERLIRFIEKFTQFEPTARTYFIAELQEEALMNKQYKLCPAQFYSLQRNFYSNTNAFCFDIGRNLKCYFLETFFCLFDCGERKIEVYQSKLNQILQYCYKFVDSESSLRELLCCLSVIQFDLYQHPEIVQINEIFSDQVITFVERVMQFKKFRVNADISAKIINLLYSLQELNPARSSSLNKFIASIEPNYDKFLSISKTAFCALKYNILALSPDYCPQEACRILKIGIGQIQKLGLTHLKKLISCQTLYLYNRYIENACKCFIDATPEVNEINLALLTGLVHVNKMLFSRETISILACYYAGKDGARFGGEFEFMLELMQKVNSCYTEAESGNQEYFHTYICYRELFISYLQTVMKSRMDFPEVYRSYRQILGSQLLGKYNNKFNFAICFVEFGLLADFFFNFSNTTREFLLQALKYCYYCQRTCGFFLRRSFKFCMDYWMMAFSRSLSIKTGTRKDVMIKLRALRNPCFQFLPRLVQLSSPHCISPAMKPSLTRASSRLKHSLKLLEANKLAKIEFSSQISLRSDEIVVYLHLMNLDVPYLSGIGDTFKK